MPHTVYGQANLAALVCVVLAAFWLGGPRERLGAGVLLAGTVASALAQRLSGRLDPAMLLLAIDLPMAAALVALTWRSPVGWPFAATAFQGVALALHVIRLLTRAMPPWTYLTAVQAVSYAVMGSLAYGTWRRQRKRRQGFSS